MYEKGKGRYKKPPTDFLRSRLCICQMKYVYYMGIKYSVQIWTYYNPNIRSCQALPKKIFEGGGGQAVSDGTNAKEKLPQGPAHRGEPCGSLYAFALVQMLSSPVIKCKKTPRKKCSFVAEEAKKR